MMTRERLCARGRDVCAKAKVDGLHLHDLHGESASQIAESGSQRTRCAIRWVICR